MTSEVIEFIITHIVVGYANGSQFIPSCHYGGSFGQTVRDCAS